MNTITRIINIAALSLATTAGTTYASALDDNPLGGPQQRSGSAVERSVEAREGFGEQRTRRRPANDENIMGAALQALNRAADEALHLTEAQRSSLDAIRADFEASVQAFREANADALEALREEAKGLREAMQAGDQTAREQMKNIRERMGELRENAPSFKDIRASVEAVLTEAQKTFVVDAMEDIRAAAMERGRRMQGDGDNAGPLDGMGAARGEGQRAEMRQREAPEGAVQLRELAARLQTLPEGDRARITELLEAMISQVEADNGIDPAETLEQIRERGERGELRNRGQRDGEPRQRRRGGNREQTDGGAA